MPRISLMLIYSMGKIPFVGILPISQLGKYFVKKFHFFAYRFYRFWPIAVIQCIAVCKNYVDLYV